MKRCVRHRSMEGLATEISIWLIHLSDPNLTPSARTRQAELRAKSSRGLPRLCAWQRGAYLGAVEADIETSSSSKEANELMS